MCVVSMLGDSWSSGFPNSYPTFPSVTRDEFEKLRREVEELKRLLIAAKRYDEATGQKDCEMDEKVEMIRKVAEAVGVNVDEVFGARD